MSNYMKLATEAGDQYLSLLADSQERFLKSVTAVASWLPAAPMPAAADVPTPREVADAGFAFAAKLLERQKAFTEKLFAATMHAG
jgi:hypothetical protein